MELALASTPFNQPSYFGSCIRIILLHQRIRIDNPGGGGGDTKHGPNTKKQTDKSAGGPTRELGRSRFPIQVLSLLRVRLQNGGQIGPPRKRRNEIVTLGLRASKLEPPPDKHT